MFRHGTYYIIANDSDKTLETIVINYANTIGFSYDYGKHVYYITVKRHIIDLRYYGITGKPHPNAKIIAGMIRNNLMELGYDFRD